MIDSTLPMKKITGSIVAIVTPMHEDGTIDHQSFRRLIEWHIAESTDAIVVAGTTGESATLTVPEHCELIQYAVTQARGRIPIIAGSGGNSTAEAIELTQFAKKAGVTASLQVVPYYNKPTQEGLYWHFRTIAETVNLPIILYNVPGRTVTDISHDTVLRLTHIPGIIGIKDATGNIDRGLQLIKAVPAEFAIYSGDDPTAVTLMLMGAQGNISVTANVAPRSMHELCMAAIEGNLALAKQLHFQLMPLNKALFVEANPIPVKWALHAMGLIAHGIRLPLTPLKQELQPLIRDALHQAKVVLI